MEKTDSRLADVLECAVCLQSCNHPVKLPCGHIFCFLCVKGVANQNRRCALCRNAIPLEYFNNPTLVGKDADATEVAPTEGATSDAEPTDEHYSWFYEGRNGWWQYDERTNVDLEENYAAKKRTFQLLIAGYMYVIDLDNMVQMRRNDLSRRRRIKRDLVSAPKKGIAGLKTVASLVDETADKVEEKPTTCIQEGASGVTETSESPTCTPSASSSKRTKPKIAGVSGDAAPAAAAATAAAAAAPAATAAASAATAAPAAPADAAADKAKTSQIASGRPTKTNTNLPAEQAKGSQSIRRGGSVQDLPSARSSRPEQRPVASSASGRRTKGPVPILRGSPPRGQPNEDSTGIDVAMGSSLHLTDDVLYELSAVPVQPTQQENH